MNIAGLICQWCGQPLKVLPPGTYPDERGDERTIVAVNLFDVVTVCLRCNEKIERLGASFAGAARRRKVTP